MGEAGPVQPHLRSTATQGGAPTELENEKRLGSGALSVTRDECSLSSRLSGPGQVSSRKHPFCHLQKEQHRYK